MQPLSVNASLHFPLLSSRWQTYAAAPPPPPPVLLPSSSALLKGKAAVGEASEEGGGQLNGWQGKDGKVAFIRLDFFQQVPFTKCHSTIARHCLMLWSDGVLNITFIYTFITLSPDA